MVSKTKILKYIMYLTPFIAIYGIIMDGYVFQTKETYTEHDYCFENAYIRPIIDISDSNFVLLNYSDFSDYNGTIYVYSKTGKSEYGGFFSPSVKWPSLLYIFYVEDGISYGIHIETEYYEPIMWYKNNQTIHVEITNKEHIFRFDYLILGIFILIFGLVSSLWVFLHSSESEFELKKELKNKNIYYQKSEFSASKIKTYLYKIKKKHGWNVFYCPIHRVEAMNVNFKRKNNQIICSASCEIKDCKETKEFVTKGRFFKKWINTKEVDQNKS